MELCSDTKKIITARKGVLLFMIGANIRKLRLQHGMTQKTLADKLFVSAQAVSRWENDEVEPSISTILELAKIFGVTADDIINPEKKETPQNEETDTEEQPTKEEPPKQESPKQILALCENCNHPIYNSNDIVRTDGKLICSKGDKDIKKREKERLLQAAKKRRTLSFIFGTLASVICLIITISVWNSPFSTPDTNGLFLFISLAMFPFISCCILNNNFVGYMFLRICTWSIKMPGLIFTLDVDGCLWFIATKILFAILGFLLGVLMFILALVISTFMSIFVYPYAIIMNIKRPEDTYL